MPLTLTNLRFFSLIILFILLSITSKAQSLLSLGDSLQNSTYKLKRYISLPTFSFNRGFQASIDSNFNFNYLTEYKLFYIQKNHNGTHHFSQYLNSTEFIKITNKYTLKKNWTTASLPKEIDNTEDNFLKPILINSPSFEKIFGGSKIEIIPKGSIDISFMGQRNLNQNLLLNERNRKLWGVDFDQNINLSLVGKIGERGNIITNFSSDPEFDFENQIKFDYVGKPDDIIQRLEIGNINFNTPSRLMSSTEALFGIKTQFQIGKVNLTTVLSQKRSDQQVIILSNGSSQREVNLSLSDYEANQHYFLAHYFRENYNKNLLQAPNVTSAIQITKVEVWVTNRGNKNEGSRDILALIDLGEKNTFNSNLIGNSAAIYPNTGIPNLGNTEISNNLLDLLTENGSNPNNNFVQSFFSNAGGTANYSKLTSARKLTETNDYIINKQLGYISLNFPLLEDQVLAVAYRFTANGKEYQVGDLSTDVPMDINSPKMLYTKLLKSETVNTKLPTWDLMMKNIYAIGGNNFNENDINLQIVRTNTESAVENPILMEGQNTANKSWLQLTFLDRLSQNNSNNADGLLDVINNVTIDIVRGKLIFPVIEPLGKDLENQFSNTEQPLKDKYVFSELYNLTQNEAKLNFSNKDKYSLKGTIQSNNISEFNLGIYSLSPNTIKVYAGSMLLQENTDYSVDYESGTLRILNQALLLANNTLKVTIEDSQLNSQQKTFIGGRLDYKPNNELLIGTTFMKLIEAPYSEKINVGFESISNIMVGADINFSKKSKWLTRVIDKLPFIKTNEESSINIYGEIAYSKPGYAKALNTENNNKGVAYLDDFESNFNFINIKNQQGWQLSGTPQLFPEHNLINDLAYGFNRAHLAFYNIDPIFYQSSQLNPNIDSKYLMDHRMRRVTEQEVFPFKEIKTGVDAFLPTLDLAYYPMIRGAYNYSSSMINIDGQLLQPKQRWGGIFKKLEQTDFETNNIEYLDIWMMDPSLTNTVKEGGDLYINLGDISEDILKDGRKTLENAIPANGDKSNIDKTVWGHVTRMKPISNAFENTDISRKNQDIGLDGLSNEEEKLFHNSFLTQMRGILSSEAYDKLVIDPSNDDYNHFRGNHFTKEHSILTRYERINGTEGNSKTQNQSLEAYGIENASRTLLPDAEDISRDNTMNEADNYYEYKISLRPQDMYVGNNFIVDEHTSEVIVLNRKKEVKWYKFRIPIRDFDKKYGNINDFKSIRFVRLFLTNFADTTVLRIAQLQFVKSDWRQYNADNNAQWVIADPKLGITPAPDQSKIEIAHINIEENGKRAPIPYVVPPHINRQIDYSNNNLDVQLNEQSLSLKLKNLKNGYGRAAFKRSSYDLRSYGNIEFFVHAEGENLNDGDAHVFIRIGVDDIQHYYQFETSLKVTPAGSSSPQIIWPIENNIIVNLNKLREVKTARDNAYRNGEPWPTDVPFEYQDANNKITIKGIPDLSRIRFYMLGIINPLNGIEKELNGEFWFNELRVTDFENKSQWAATGQLHVKLADLGNITLSGTKMSAGFGDISQRISEQNRMEKISFDFAANAELGKFIQPKHVNAISIPLYFNLSKQIGTPEYNPFIGDILLKHSFKNQTDKAADSLLRIVQDFTYRKNFSIVNARKLFISTNEIVKPWNIENFSLSYAYNEYLHRDLTTVSSLQKNYKGALDYAFNNSNIRFKEPFKSNKLFKNLNYNLIPSILSFRLEVNRVYQENTFRDNSNNNVLPTYYNKNFNTNRIYGISWDLTKSLRFDFNATNYAIIDEPYGRIDGALKDTIWNNFWKLGRNMDYNHMLNLTYTLPLYKIPYLEWLKVTTRYGSQFNWQSEPLNLYQNEDIDLGNSIQNNRTIQINPNLNFNALYNKFSFIRQNSHQNTTSLSSILVKLITSVKSINSAYTKVEGTHLPGYKPNSNILGYSFNQNAPGWDFVLGSQIDIYNRAKQNGWLTTDTLQTSMLTKSYAENLSVMAYTEPIKGLRLDFTFTRMDNKNSSLPFQSTNTEKFYEIGSYSISQIGIKQSFKKSFRLFQEFENTKQTISELLGNYNPNSAGWDKNKFADGYNENQQDVIINSFLNTYLNKKFNIENSHKITFPLPNWRLNFSGIAELLGINNAIQAVNINHTYQSNYSISNYFTNTRFELVDNYPFVRDGNNNFIPFQQYSQVTLTDRFLPLIGIDMRLDNNLSLTSEYRKSREIALNLENSQLSTLDEKSIIAGIAYRKLNTRLPFGLFANHNWRNDVNFKIDVAINDRIVHIFRTMVKYQETTSGNKNITINPSLDYTINKFYNIRLFYNTNAVRPYTSQIFASSYTNFGFSFRLQFQ